MADLREALESAFDSVSGGGDGGEAPAQPSPAGDSAPVDVTPAADTGAASAATDRPSADRSRDEKGRFAPKGETKPAPGAEIKPAPVVTQPAVQAPATAEMKPEPAAPALKPPQSWKPLAREKWGTLPPDVQAEVVRVDGEVRRVMQESAQARKLAGEFQQAVQPYIGMIQAEGSTPIQTVNNLLQTAVALRTAPPAHKAQLIAGLVKSFGVPVEALDAALSGEQVQAQQQQPYQDPRVDKMMQMFESAQRERQVAAQRQVQTELQTFAQAHEFYEDLRDEMADLVDVAARRGVALSLDDAYNKALKLHPELSKVMEQREAAKAAPTAQAATARSKAASSSVKSAPAVSSGGADTKDLRSALEAAFDAASRR